MQGKRGGDFPFFKVGDISEAWKQSRTYLSQANNYLTYDQASSIHANPLPRDTTVFAKIGAAIALNRRAILSEPSLVDNNVMGIHPTVEGLESKIVFYFMCTVRLGDISRATTVPSVRKSDVESIPFPLAPLPEQRRIVAEIEKQFTRLDASVAALRRAQVNLKRCRASVLKSACEGALAPTEAELARAEGRDYEPAGLLLERILSERRIRWESQEKRRGKYQEPSPPDASGLPALPEGWVWATVEQLLVRPLTNGRSVKRADEGFPVLRLTSLRGGVIDQNERKIGAWTAEEAGRFLIQEGDFLVSRGSGSLRLVGIGGLVESVKAPIAYPDTMIRFRLSNDVSRPFFSHVWNSRTIRVRLEPKAKTTAGIFKVNQSDLSACVVPIPPLAEQRRIVAEVERRLSVVQQSEAIVGASLKRAERLRQSILKQAFSGRLAPQEAGDEPAAALLARIKADGGRPHPRPLSRGERGV